jgi:hypothetical protein
MKHLKTFESFQINEEEEIIGAIKKAMDDRKIEKYKKNLQAALDKFAGPNAPRAWKEKLNDPTEEILAKFWKDAEADEYKSGQYDVASQNGSFGVGIDKQGNLRYRPYSEIKEGDAKKHSFGGGA